MEKITHTLNLRRLGIDTYKEAVIYMHKDCHVCRSEGFEAQSRILVKLGKKSIIATLNIIDSNLLEIDKAGLSEYAWQLLGASEGDEIYLSHPKPLISLSYVRSKIYGNLLTENEIKEIVADISIGLYSDIHISAFLTACAGGRMNLQEIINLTKAMIEAGDTIKWHSKMVVDKHCVGGLPGNRTSPIVVAIVAAFGLTMPKTSSRSITSPAGTADTMEVFAPVEMDIKTMKEVVGKEGGCIVWGGNVSLSPADDILIRVEKAIDLDSEGQLVASVLSKKIAAGSTHILIDIPIGKTAKVRSKEMAGMFKHYLETVGSALGVEVKVIFSNGTQPVGRGIGPALEARDILEVLQCKDNASEDLRDKSIELAGHIIEFSSDVKKGEGIKIATQILNSGKAWQKFQGICAAQGGIREIPKAQYTHIIKAEKDGNMKQINNRHIALIAKLAGAPHDKTAGVDLHVRIGDKIKKNQPLFTLHANTPGGMEYAQDYIRKYDHIISIG